MNVRRDVQIERLRLVNVPLPNGSGTNAPELINGVRLFVVPKRLWA